VAALWVVVLGGIPQQPVPRSARTRVIVDECERILFTASDACGVFDRIADSCRTADELRVAVVSLTDSVEPTEDEGDLRAEDPTVAVNFVDDDGF